TPDIGANWGWYVFRRSYEKNESPSTDDLIRVLPEREQLLVRGRYDAPAHRYDEREENDRQRAEEEKRTRWLNPQHTVGIVEPEPQPRRRRTQPASTRPIGGGH